MFEEMPVSRIIASIADCAARWANADFPARVRVTRDLCERTGYSEPMIDFALDTLFNALSEAELRRAVVAEIGSLSALDEWVALPHGGRMRYAGRGRTAIIASRTTVGVALFPAIFALLAKNTVFIKDRADNLCGAFFRTLARDDSRFADAVTTAVFDSADARDLSGFATVVAFGGNDALRRIRASLDAVTHFVGFGPRISCGILDLAEFDRGDAGTTDVVLDGLARDAVLYDAEGCMSLHVLFVLDAAESPDVAPLGEAIRAACERMLIEFPPGDGAARAADGFAARAAARFRAAEKSAYFGGSSDTASMAVYHDDGPPPLLPRMLPMVRVASPEEIRAYLTRHRLAVEAVSITPHSDRLLAAAAATGAVRITRFGELQRPQVSSGHGGMNRLAPFIRRCDDTD